MTGENVNGQSARDMANRWPRFAEALQDFYLMQSQPQAFEWREMPDGWKFCQRVFAAEARRIPNREQVEVKKMFKAFLEAIAKRGI